MQELITIQVIWERDFIHEFNVSNIYKSVYGNIFDHNASDEIIREEYRILQKICKEYKLDYKIIKNLLEAERNRMLVMNKRGIQKDLENILREYVKPTVTNVYKTINNK